MPTQDVLQSSLKVREKDDEEGQLKKKRHRKVMTKKTRDVLQSSLEFIDSSVLVLQAVE